MTSPFYFRMFDYTVPQNMIKTTSSTCSLTLFGYTLWSNSCAPTMPPGYVFKEVNTCIHGNTLSVAGKVRSAKFPGVCEVYQQTGKTTETPAKIETLRQSLLASFRQTEPIGHNGMKEPTLVKCSLHQGNDQKTTESLAECIKLGNQAVRSLQTQNPPQDLRLKFSMDVGPGPSIKQDAELQGGEVHFHLHSVT